MKRLKKVISLLLSVSLAAFVLTGAGAQSFPLESLVTGEDDSPVRVRLYAPAYAVLSQFDEQRLDQFNRLLKHFSLDVALDGETSAVSVSVDDEQAVSLLRKEETDLARMICSAAPSVEYVFDAHEAEEEETSFLSVLQSEVLDVNALLDAFHPLFAAFPERFADYAKQAGTDLRLKGYGKASKRINFTFPADYAESDLPAALASLAGSGTAKSHLSGLVFSGKQKVSLLLDQQGNLLRVTYDGKAGYSPELLYTVSINWKCLRTDTQLKDSLTMSRKPVSGKAYVNVQYDRSSGLEEEDSKNTVHCELSRDSRNDEGNKQHIGFQADLESVSGGIAGTVKYVNKDSEHDTSLVILPHLKKADNPGEFGGTLEIAEYSGKIVTSSLSLSLLVQRGEDLAWPSGGVSETRHPATEEEDAALDELRNLVVRGVLPRMMTLPEEDLLLISDGIAPEDWANLF